MYQARMDRSISSLTASIIRIMGNDPNFEAHNKVVCVDRTLLYVGSDNAFPQYNEQHGALD